MKTLFSALLLWAPLTLGAPLYQARSEEGSLVVLHSEPCALEVVKNLPRRATWTNGAKTWEGCWGAYQPLGLVVFYFEDKTVVLISVYHFSKVPRT